MALKDDLRAARALIDTPDKWCKGSGYIIDGEHMSRCAMHALGDVTGGNRPAFEAVRDALRVHTGRRIVLWNDDPERTHADVLAVFDAAIASAT